MENNLYNKKFQHCLLVEKFTCVYYRFFHFDDNSTIRTTRHLDKQGKILYELVEIVEAELGIKELKRSFSIEELYEGEEIKLKYDNRN